MAVMGKEVAWYQVKKKQTKKLYMQRTLYQGNASETFTFHKQTLPLSGSSKDQLPSRGHENIKTLFRLLKYLLQQLYSSGIQASH